MRVGRLRPIDPSAALLVKGGTIISMDSKVGDLATGDVLIEGNTIAAIGPTSRPAGAQVIDAANRIIIPGFVDCHRHSWEGQLRRINPNAKTHRRIFECDASLLRDALPAAGPLCRQSADRIRLHRFRHHLPHRQLAQCASGAHSDAAVEALLDSGIRAVHASGAPQAGEWDRQWPQRSGPA